MQLPEDLQLIEKIYNQTVNQKKGCISLDDPIIYKFFKDFTKRRKKTNRAVVFSSRPFSNILKYSEHWQNLLTIWNTRLLQTYIEKFSWYG